MIEQNHPLDAPYRLNSQPGNKSVTVQQVSKVLPYRSLTTETGINSLILRLANSTGVATSLPRSTCTSAALARLLALHVCLLIPWDLWTNKTSIQLLSLSFSSFLPTCGRWALSVRLLALHPSAGRWTVLDKHRPFAAN